MAQRPSRPRRAPKPPTLHELAIHAYEKRAGHPWSDHLKTVLHAELDRQERVEDKAAAALRTLRSAVNASMRLAEANGFDPVKPNWGKIMMGGPFGVLMNWLARNHEAIQALGGSRTTRRTTPADRHRRVVVELFELDPAGLVLPKLAAAKFEGAANYGTRERPLNIIRLPGDQDIWRRSNRELAAISILCRREDENVRATDARAEFIRETRAIAAIRARIKRGAAGHAKRRR